MARNIIERKAVIIPGAQKSGTTTLFEILSNHSAINRPKIKEPHFFALERETILENLSWYEKFFLYKKKEILLDASTTYFSNKRAPQFIKEFIQDPKILIILRDPVKRAYSGFLHMHKKVPCCDMRSFGSIIREIKGPNRDTIISSENNSLEKAVRNGKINPNYLNEAHTTLLNQFGVDFKSNIEKTKFRGISRAREKSKYLWNYKYFQESLYSDKVNNYEKIFGDKIKVIFFENLILDPEATIGDIFKFIGIEPENQKLKLHHRHKTMVPRNHIARWFIKNRKNNLVTGILYKIFESVGAIYKSKPQLSKKEYYQARKILSEEYKFWFSKYKELENVWLY